MASVATFLSAAQGSLGLDDLMVLPDELEHVTWFVMDHRKVAPGLRRRRVAALGVFGVKFLLLLVPMLTSCTN